MSDIDSLLTLVDRYGQARQVGDARVSTLVFNDGGRIAQIRAGGDIGTKRLYRAITWFSDNWPDGAVWPPTIARPRQKREAAA